MDETSDLQIISVLAVSAVVLFIGGFLAGAHQVNKKHQYGCSPEVLVAYTEGYQECKAGK